MLVALGLPYERAIGSVRFTIGMATTAADIDYLLDSLPALIERLRSVSPAYRETELRVLS